MDTVKLFVALSIEKAYIKHLFKEFESLNLPWEKIKKVNDEQIHLTLKFLGFTNLEKIPIIIDALEGIKISTQELALSIDKTAIFNEKNPRTLTLSLKINEDLQDLYDQIDRSLLEANVSNMEIRKFRPHLTLARIKKVSKISEFDDFIKWQPNKDFVLTHFDLIESKTSKNGPIYNTLQSFDL